MSITTNAEAQAVHTLLTYLLPRLNNLDGQPTSDEARDAAALLTRSAHNKMMAGPSTEDVRFYWDNGVLPTLRGQL
jgi:hypothetical protein